MSASERKRAIMDKENISEKTYHKDMRTIMGGAIDRLQDDNIQLFIAKIASRLEENVTILDGILKNPETLNKDNVSAAKEIRNTYKDILHMAQDLGFAPKAASVHIYEGVDKLIGSNCEHCIIFERLVQGGFLCAACSKKIREPNKVIDLE